MYRIELSPGEETVFRSIEELAVAIRRKVVTSRARIYHNATAKWLPIQFHPHYKLALSMPLTQADLVAGPPVTPRSNLELGEAASRTTSSTVPSSATHEAAAQAALTAWPEPKPNPPPPAPKPAAQSIPKQPVVSQLPIMLGTPAPEPRRREPVRPPEPRRTVAPTRFVERARREEPAPAKASRRRRKPLRSLRVALAGAVLIACAHLAISATSIPDPEVTARPRTPRRLVEAPAEALTDSPRTVAAVLPGLQSIPGITNALGVSAATDSAAADSSAPEIQPAPDAANINVAVPGGTGSLAPQIIDSSGKKNLKRLLRTLEGTPAVEGKSTRR